MAKVLFPDPLSPTIPTKVACRNGDGHIFQHHRRVVPETERDIFAENLAFDEGKRNLRQLILAALLRGIDNIGKPFKRHAGFLKILPELGKPHHRTGDITGNNPECNKLAEGHLIIQAQDRRLPRSQ